MTWLVAPVLLGATLGWLVASLPLRLRRWLRRHLGPPAAYWWTAGMGYCYWRAVLADDLPWVVAGVMMGLLALLALRHD